MQESRALEICNEQRGQPVAGWIVESYLGHGGSAVVLRATKDNVTAALKIIDPEIVDRFGRAEQTQRVERERLLIGAYHPNLVRIYDAGVCDRTNYLYVAMELIESPTLTKLIPNFPPERVPKIIAQVADAAKFLEDRDFIHRDIKPDNIAIDRDFSSATLLDLGVIRPVANSNTDLTTATAFLGTTRYSSPEYLLREGEEHTTTGWRALTFYQLGALLHDMIMQKRLFDDIDAPPARLTDAVRYTTPLVESSQVDPHFVALARSCLQKDWQLRLKLVSWDQFTRVSDILDIETTTNQIADRVGTQSVRSKADNHPSKGSKRLLITSLQNRVAAEISKQCTESGLFPPIRIDTSTVAAGDDTATLRLHSRPSSEHALAHGLTIIFRMTLLSHDSGYIRIEGMGSIEGTGIGARTGAFQAVFIGQLDTPNVGNSIRRFLLFALDAAQRQMVVGNTNILLIRGGAGDAE